MKNAQENIHTLIWEEQAEDDNPFAAASCFCHGYNVYGECLQSITLAFTGYQNRINLA